MVEAIVASDLKAKQRLVRDWQPESLSVRLHRAISWLARAEAEADLDARFLFLWIGLNAAYAQEFGYETSERNQSADFAAKVVQCDAQGRLQAALFEKFTGPVRGLIDNKFVYEPFWRAMREHDSSGRWSESFASSQRLALRAVMDRQADVVLSVVLDRLHVLRNQIVHGGATWNSSANRAQVKDGVAILSIVLPIILDIMMDAPDVDFGNIAYPWVS